MLNLDTHILIFAISGNLRPEEHKVLANNRWSISSIVWWEFAKLVQLGRINTDYDEAQLKHRLRSMHVWSVNMDVAYASTRLDFQGDPADEIIAATSVVYELPLVTRDQKILKSQLVPFASAVSVN